MTDTVSLNLTSCEECPNMKSDRHYTADSWEQCYEWKCKAAGNKTISFQDTFDKAPPIPKWCPLRG